MDREVIREIVQAEVKAVLLSLLKDAEEQQEYFRKKDEEIQRRFESVGEAYQMVSSPLSTFFMTAVRTYVLA